MRRILVLLGLGAFILGLLITWFSGNFFYDLVWAFLEQYHVKEADVIAYTLGHIVPFLLSTATIAILFFVIRYELSRQHAATVDVAAQRDMAAALNRQAAALERERESRLPPSIQNFMDAINRQERIALGLETDPNKPALAIRISGCAYDGDADQHGERNIHVFLAELTGGDRLLSKCQIHLENSGGHKWVLSKPFDLRPGEPKTIPLIRYRESQKAQENRAFIYMLRDDGERPENDGRLILGPGRFTVKVLSQEAKPVTLTMQLSKHPTDAGHWLLEEVSHAPKT